MVAWGSVVLLLITGLMKTPGTMLLDGSSPMGLKLLIKHLAFLVMIVNGLIITFVAAPRLRANSPAPGSPPPPAFVGALKLIEGLSGANTLLGVAILWLVATF